MIPEPGDADREVPVNETFHEQTDDELTEKELKQVEADDQAIQTILLGLPEDIYDVVDSCETAQEIWLRVQQMMKGSDIGIQEKKAKLFNEWERFTSTNGESIESYYHCFSKLMNDFKRNKHFPEKIATDYTQLYDFLKYNQKEVDDLRAERLAKTHDPLALMANSNNPFNYPVFHQDQPLSNPTTAMNMTLVLMAKAFKLNYLTPTNNNQRISSNPCNRQIAQPGMNIGQDRHIQMIGGNGGNQFRQYAGQNVGNPNRYNAVQNVGNQVVHNVVHNLGVQNGGNQNGLIVVLGIANQNPNGNGNVVAARAEGNAIGNNGNQIRCYNYRGLGHLARNYTVRPMRRDAAYLQTQLLIAQKEEAGIQLLAEEFDLMAAATDLDEIEEVNANYILMATLSAKVHNYDNCYDNEIFNMFTQEEQYTELLEPIPKPHQVQQNDSNVIYEVSGVEQDGGTVDQHPVTVEETQATKFVRDFKSLAKEAYESLVKHKALELEIERLLRAIVSQDIMSIVQNPSVVDSSNLQTELEPYNDMQQKILRLQAQLGDQKGKSKDTPCVSNTLDPLSQKLENENVELDFQVSKQKDTTKGTSMNTQFCKQSILGKPPSSSGSKLYAVTPFPKSKGLPKIDETHALSKLVTSNSVPTPQESKVVKNDNVIAPRIFRINPFKPSREEKYVANKVRSSVRTNPITVSQPHVITKKDVNSNSNGLSSTGVDNTAKTRRPQPRSNTKNDRVPSAFKSSLQQE
ncbi:hypothetical protein Tco_0955786 [Tanacetum coccineum]|uniref:Retrotransposon gag domain-containing protein n=1 Tax=Tanacetum coccineum TaxID=301880 RepID=A0ABQ5E859_9ASTR